MKQIPLSTTGKHKGKYFAVVDDEDFERVNKYKWQVNFNQYTNYAQRQPLINGRKTVFKLHRFILGVTDPKILVDHENGNGLDCRRNNIRIANATQNGYNSRKHIKSSSKYKGVCIYIHHAKYKNKKGIVKNYPYKQIIAQIAINGKNKKLGRFNTEKEAAIAYNRYAQLHFGEFARLNKI